MSVDSDVTGVCGSCRRLLDADGLPFGPTLSLIILDDRSPKPRLIDNGEGRNFMWSEDGGDVRIDARRLTIIDMQLMNALGKG